MLFSKEWLSKFSTDQSYPEVYKSRLLGPSPGVIDSAGSGWDVTGSQMMLMLSRNHILSVSAPNLCSLFLAPGFRVFS